MSVVGLLAAIASLFDKLLGLFRTHKEQSTGAALERGKASEDELARITKAVDARLNPAVDGVHLDPWDRDNSERNS